MRIKCENGLPYNRPILQYSLQITHHSHNNETIIYWIGL